MRKKNSVCEFSSRRSQALLQNFRVSLAQQSKISLQKAFQDAVDAPAPRFWVSEARATRVINCMLKGIPITEGMLPEKKKMYAHILSKVLEQLKISPQTPVGDIVFEIVNGPAPCCYLSPARAKKIILAEKRLQRQNPQTL